MTHVDAMLFCMQACPHENQIMRSHSLRVRLGMVIGIMAKVIEYYIPARFRKKRKKWIPLDQRGKIIPFPVPEKKSA